MKKRILLLGLLYMNALVATLGGIGLMMGKIPMPESYLSQTSFVSFYFPGVILFAVVGGSAWLAALAVQKKLVGGSIAAVLSGIIMLCWLVGEIASIRELHALQLVFMATAVAVIVLTPSDSIRKSVR